MGCGGCASANERCGNGLEKIYPTTAIRYGRMRHIGEFSHPPDMMFSCGAKVVISTERGIEIGEQVSLTCFRLREIDHPRADEGLCRRERC